MDDKKNNSTTSTGSIITEQIGVQTDFEETTSVISHDVSQNVKSSTTSVSRESAADKSDSDTTTSSSQKELLNIPRRYKKRILLTNG